MAKQYSPYLKLGVELEVEIKNDPTPNTQHISDYIIYGSYPKHKKLGNTHSKHGWLIKLSDQKVGDKIEVHYDNTINDGWEWIGKPMTLEENKREWAKILDHEILNNFIHGDDVSVTDGNGYGIHDVGMHVHVSGDPINKEVLGKLLVFYNAPKNKEFLETIAGRAFNKFCKTQTGLTVQDSEYLYHSSDCIRISRRNKKITLQADHSLDIFYAGTYCCNNGNNLAHKYHGRGAICVTPFFGAGDFEIRIFKSTVILEKFYTNLEFVVALTDYCVSEEKLSYKDFGAWMSTTINKVKYSNLFKFMRRHGYTEGIVPRKETLKAMMVKGNLDESSLLGLVA